MPVFGGTSHARIGGGGTGVGVAVGVGVGGGVEVGEGVGGNVIGIGVQTAAPVFGVELGAADRSPHPDVSTVTRMSATTSRIETAEG